MERFSVHFEQDPTDQESYKLVNELKRLGANRVLEWLWVLRSDLECSELQDHLRRYRKAEDFVIEQIHRAEYRALLDMAKEAAKNPTKPSLLKALTSLKHRGRPG